MKREEALKFWKFRYENAKDFSDPHWEAQERREHREYVEALRMAIEALSKPNYESDTEVRLAVTNRNKDKVVLCDAFGEVEYYPNGEINCVNCPHYYETEDDTGVHSHCGSHGRLIDADALLETVDRIGLTCDGGVDINDIEGTIQEMATADRPNGEWIPVTERLPEIDETLHLCDQISDEVLGTDTYGNIRHVYLTKCGYLKPTFCTVEEGMSVDIVAWMPLPEPYEEVER